MFKFRNVAYSHTIVPLLLTPGVLFCHLLAQGQSFAPGTGRHIRRDRVSVAAAKLAKSAAEADKAKNAAATASTPTARANAIKKIQTANTHLYSAAVQAANVDPDVAATVQDAATNVNKAISSNTSNSSKQLNDAATAVGEAVSTANNASTTISSQGTDPTANLNWLLPTTLKKGGGVLGSDGTATNAYFNANGPLAFVTKIKYTYNPFTSINALSSDLIAMQFPYLGFQLALGGNATNNPSSTNNSASNAASSGTTISSTPTATSVQQAIQQLNQGGDFYLKWTLPVVYTPASNAMQVQAFTTSLFGYELSGQTAQNTVNTASHTNENVVGEGYFQWDALPDTSSDATNTESLGSIYLDGRIGWQKLSSGEAANAGLGSTTSYRLAQLALGIVFNGYATVSAQRYWGPEQAYVGANGSPVTVNNFSKWQISVQISPAVASGKAN